MPSLSRKVTAPKAPFSFKRNILPPAIGILIMLMIFGLLNAQWLTAQFNYRSHRSLPIITVPTATASEQPTHPTIPQDASEILIPKIAVKSPIIFENSHLEPAVQKALQNGVVHYGSTAMPGGRGNAVIVGHSSGLPWGAGNYKFVFTLLNKLEKDDQIIVNYKGNQYIYKVMDSQVVAPSDLSVLNQSYPQPLLSLITCTPVGTSKNRLVVRALQVYPNPAAAKPSPDNKAPVGVKLLPV